MAYEPPEDFLVVIIDVLHSRFGQVAKLVTHNEELDELHVMTEDGMEFVFRENIFSKKPLPPEVCVFRKNDWEGIGKFQKRLGEIKNELKALQSVVDLPRISSKVRLEAKEEIQRLVGIHSAKKP